MIATSTMSCDGFRNRFDRRRLLAQPVGAQTLPLASDHPCAIQHRHHHRPVLLATGISFADYKPAKDIMTFLARPRHDRPRYSALQKQSNLFRKSRSRSCRRARGIA